MSETRIRRTIAERKADLQAQIESLAAREAEEAYSDTAPIKFLAGEFAQLAENASQAKKGLTSKNPAQSFAARRQSHQVWIEEINALEAASSAVMSFHGEAEPVYNALMGEAVEMLENGSTEDEALEYVQTELPTRLASCSEVAEKAQELSAQATAATEARKAFIEAKRNGNSTPAPQPETPEEEIESEDSEDDE